MKRKLIIGLVVCIAYHIPTYAQLGKLKQMMGKGGEKTETADTTKKEKKPGFGAGLMNKAVGSIAKVAGGIAGKMGGLTATTSDLNTVNPQVVYMTNLYSKDVNVLLQTFFEGWETGGSSIMLNFSAKEGIQLNKIDGEVKVDGSPANFVTMGTYSKFVADKAQPKKIEITTTSGQQSAFTILPPKQEVKIISINGQKENISLDLSKDVVLELDNGAADKTTPVLVWLTGQTIGLRTWYEVGWFAPKSKITVPAAMFKNMNIGTNPINFANTYLQVSRSKYEKAVDVSGIFPEVVYASYTSDVKPVNVTVKPEFNRGIEIKEKLAAASGNEIKIEANKSNAIKSAPLSRLSNIGFATLSMQGTTTYYDVSQNKFMGTETTKSVDFPVFPEEVYQNIMAKAYPLMVKILQEETKAKVVPLEQVAGTSAYKAAKTYSIFGNQTKADYNFTYKNSKQMIGFKPIAEANGMNSPEHKIMQQSGTNALIKSTFYLDVNWDGPDAVMIPKLVFEIPGETVGEIYTTNYMNATIHGKPYKIKNKSAITPAVLESEVIKMPDLLEGFRKSLQLMKAKETAIGDYEIEWQSMNK